VRPIIQAYYVVSKTAHKHGEKIAHQADTSRNTLEKHEANAPVRLVSSRTSAPGRNANRPPLMVQNPAPWPKDGQNVEKLESVKTYSVRSLFSAPCLLLLSAAMQLNQLTLVRILGGRPSERVSTA
jgi:hypothetical protein